MPGNLQKIQRFVVLMLENRSFDHLVGYLKTLNANIAGLVGDEFSNPTDPSNPASPVIKTSPASSPQMTFDPGHEFEDVQIQLYGSNGATPPIANPPTNPPPMNGFVVSANQAAGAANKPADALRIMECFTPAQVPVLSRLAQEFALFNFWYSSLPGPTWPNRFFIHGATSGGLTDSPDEFHIIEGFSFKNNTIYHAISDAGKDWRIYHDGLPQTAGIDSLRLSYVDPFTRHFRNMEHFENDIKNGLLPEYTFIEPNYSTGDNYVTGNSMHPLNDVHEGEKLVKRVYEALRNSNYWLDTMFIITFDEHGGFFDHVAPAATVATGDDTKYSNPAHPFAFKQLGIRVPAIVISAYTDKGTVIGTSRDDAATVFDHSSVLATVEKRFGLQSLTQRDRKANTLEVALNLDVPRTDAPIGVP
jgi:phospholipase C